MRKEQSLFLGIDLGSTTFKVVLLNEEGKVLHSLYERTEPVEASPRVACTGRCSECGACSFGVLKNTVEDFCGQIGIYKEEVHSTAVTGSQVVKDTKRFLNYDYSISEVTAHAHGARHYYPDCKAILDVGGQDSKAMIYNDSMGMWTSKMSGICAAGTGAFLDSVAAKLGVPVEELSDRANFDSELEFSSVCAVLAATSINKFKNRYPMDQIIGSACRAQARTIMSGVGDILLNYDGDILFQGGVAYNRAVAYFLKEITGNNIVIPKFHNVMGALGAACIARKYALLDGTFSKPKIPLEKAKLKSVSVRASQTRKAFFSSDKSPLVWRNLFFPSEILNALGVRMLTLETYAALFARSRKRITRAFDVATYKGFSAETCSFLRVLEGMELPKPDFAVSTSEPCQQGERIFNDLARTYGFQDKFYSLSTPAKHDDLAIEQIASGLQLAVVEMEKATGLKMDPQKLKNACELSNEARTYSNLISDLRVHSAPLIPGTIAVYFASVFSQQWGKKELLDLHKMFYDELCAIKENVESDSDADQTNRLMWLHLPPFYNTELMHFIESECGMPIVFEEVNWTKWTELDSSDPYRSLAKKLLSVGFLDPQLRVQYIKDQAKEGKMTGCILYNHGFGRCSMADNSFIRHLREELTEINIPLLVLDGDCMDPTVDPCSTKTKVKAFAESLNMKKYGNPFGKLDESIVAELKKHLKQIKNLDTIPFGLAKKYLQKVKKAVDSSVS